MMDVLGGQRRVPCILHTVHSEATLTRIPRGHRLAIYACIGVTNGARVALARSSLNNQNMNINSAATWARVRPQSTEGSAHRT